MPLQGELAVERMCQMAQVSRAGFYRFLQRGWSGEENVALRAAVQEVVVEHRWRYGYRRVTEELRSRGWSVNHKRIARMMQEDNLLAVRRDWPNAHGLSMQVAQIYLNLSKRMTLTGRDQLWVADVTYIRLAREFVYLAVVLDAYSRKVIGWELGRSLQARLCISALERAISNRKPAHGLVHHSDQGVQYASRKYMELLRDHGILTSMSRPGNPYDNATCESFIRTLKREEINAYLYRDFEELQERVEEFMEKYYNQCRLHSALGYLAPATYEEKSPFGGGRNAAIMTFSTD